MTYEIIYNHEVIDIVNTKEEAQLLVQEYRTAFKSNDVYCRVLYC